MTVPVPTTVTPETVLNVTGATVTAAQIGQATAIVELCMAVDLGNLANLRSTNRRWAVRAVCYQTAWMLGQPDLFERVDVTSMSQDGLTLATRDADSLLVAPLARKALKRVSWNRSRTVLVGPGRAARLARFAVAEQEYGLGGGSGGGGFTDSPIEAGRGYYDSDDDTSSSSPWGAF